MKTKVAIIGSGFGMYGLLPAFNAVKNCEVIAICGQDFKKMQKYWNGNDPNKIYTDWEKMLRSEKPDAVAIAVVPKYQLEIAKYALANNIAVFAEKPLATSVAASLELCKLAEKNKLPNMVDFMFPEIPEWIEAKKLIESGAIGKVIAMDVEWNFLSHDLKNNIASWKTDVKQGGGALSFFFSHVFYYLENFMGKIENLECLTSTSKKSKNRGETVVHIIAKFKHGCVCNAHVNAGYVGQQKHKIEFQGEEGVVVVQSRGDGYVNGFELTIEAAGGVKKVKPTTSFDVSLNASEDPRVAPVAAVAQRFIDWCNYGSKSKPNFEDGLRVQKLIEAARVSSFKFLKKVK